MDTEDQIQKVFQNFGMNPAQINYNKQLDQYYVDIGVEGTDDKFLRGIRELGSSGSVDEAVDTNKLKVMANQIQDSQVLDGSINVKNMMGDSHFLIEVS